MAIAVRSGVLLLCLALSSYCAVSKVVINVLKFGAKPDPKFDSTGAFMKAWQVVKRSPLHATLLVPKGEFKVSSMFFGGPCLSVTGVTIEVQGTILAPMDPSEYVNGDWLLFQDLVGLNLMGGGTFNAQGKIVWGSSQPCQPDDTSCIRSPATFQFMNVKKSIVQNIKSVDAMGYDMTISNSEDITIKSFEMITSPSSPNTQNPITIDNTSRNIKISQTTFRHGADCVSLARGPTDPAIINSKCL